MNDLHARLEQLERRNAALETSVRRWSRGFAAAAMVGGVALAMGQAAPDQAPAIPRDAAISPKEITTRSITIVDDAGRPRMEIGVDKDGAGLDVRDARGKVRIALGDGPEEGKAGDEVGLWVMDARERPRVGLGLGGDGFGLIVLDEAGKPVAGQGKSLR